MAMAAMETITTATATIAINVTTATIAINITTMATISSSASL